MIDVDEQSRLEEAIEKYNDLREQIDKLITSEPALMGGDAWLVHACHASDMTLQVEDNGITAYGSCYTSQTMCQEWFSFNIPWEKLN